MTPQIMDSRKFEFIAWSSKVIEIMMLKASKCLVFPIPPVLTPTSGGMHCSINIIYTGLESIACELQFCCRHYGSVFNLYSFSHCYLLKLRNSDKI